MRSAGRANSDQFATHHPPDKTRTALLQQRSTGPGNPGNSADTLSEPGVPIRNSEIPELRISGTPDFIR
jgi:hypothetical protein